ncbi:response regulator transcription factor [Candidatus Chloroploca sp. Khr17]|uniref:response regulator transcription factor n=1 Tax=Candidatus Chloroploca sp. Khr17 TaxID=2496869 RepID=UPI00101D39FE|nr:response regulator transcription factor [Candidatus Chloroploca sp. Khr17]
MSDTIHQLGTSPRVLLVIDQPMLAQYVTLALNHSISLTQVAQNTEETMAALTSWRPHLAIVDMDLAYGAILERLGYTAPSNDHIPVIALTRRGDLQTKLAAFDHGVDDILTVPFSPEELVARVLVIMRRTYYEKVTLTPVLKLGDLEIDILNCLVRVHGKDLHLTAIEQNLLYLLAANAGRLLTRNEIMDQLWGTDYIAESNVVDRHIRNLRIKLQNGWRAPRYIATIPGQGYRFVATAETDPPAT